MEEIFEGKAHPKLGGTITSTLSYSRPLLTSHFLASG